MDGYQIDRWMGGWILDRQIDGQIDRWMDTRQIDGWVGGWMDGQMKNCIDIHVHV